MDWIKTTHGMEAVTEGRNYLITKNINGYDVYCDGEIIDDGLAKLEYAKDRADDHANDHATSPDEPIEQGVHIDNIAGQQLIDILKRSFTTAQIQDFIDASPYDEPDTGAPEGGPLG